MHVYVKHFFLLLMSAFLQNMKKKNKETILKRKKCAHSGLHSMSSLRWIQYIKEINTAVGSPKTSGDLWLVSVSQASGESIFSHSCACLVNVQHALTNTRSLTQPHKTERERLRFELSGCNSQPKTNNYK